MATQSSLQFTFDEDFTSGKLLQILISENSVINTYDWNWVFNRISAFQVTQGTPTATVGETTAINFAFAFDADKNQLSEYTVSQVGNVLTLTSLNEDNFFFGVEGYENVVITNPVPDPKVFNRINSRSPYFAIAPIYNGTTIIDPISADFELKVWTGDLYSDRPITPNYTMTKRPRYIGDSHLFLDVSKQIEDFIDITYNGTLTDEPVWVLIDVTTTYDSGTINEITELVAFDGYNHYKDGVNPLLDDLLINNRSISVLSGNALNVPFFKGNKDYTIEFRNSTSVLNTQSFTNVSVTNTNQLVQNFTYTNELVNNIRIVNNTDLTEFVIDVEQVTECIYTPVKCIFVNKQGVKQEFYFYKSNKESLDVTKKDYKANILTESVVNNVPTISYDTSKHINRKYNTQANKSIELNTGYISEDNNIIIEELLLSESVWLEIENIIYPVDATTKSQEYLTKINDQLIKYAIKFDYSFDVVQNIR